MIAISYRREDSLPIAGRLYDRLQAKFGKKNVFMDFDSIPPGADFRQHIKQIIERSRLVIAIIGPHWLGEQPDASRRIDNPADFVRLEIAYALESGIPVIPLLINTTQMPKPETLPPDIQELAFRHALPLDSGLDFHSHADRLITGIHKAMAVAPRSGRRQQVAEPTASAVDTRPLRKIVIWSAAILLAGALLALAVRYVATHELQPAKQVATADESNRGRVESVTTPPLFVKPSVESSSPPRLASEQPKSIVEQRSQPQIPRPALDFASITKEHPYVNSLGMRFVPVPITGGPTSGQPVLFSIWDTRVKDFAAFVEQGGYDMSKGEAALTIESDGKGGWSWKQAGGNWKDPHFPPEASQTEEHPAVCISWNDAVAFCKWLTDKEHRSGQLPQEWSYRLPSDHEWSCAVGIGEREDASKTPTAKSSKIEGIYPWGRQWPPPNGAGNYAGEESRIGEGIKKWGVKGYRDDYPRTSPVGSFDANEYGIYDIGGNVWQWCQDKYESGQMWRVLRGASWIDFLPGHPLSSCRTGFAPVVRRDDNGFRVVVARSSSENPALSESAQSNEVPPGAHSTRSEFSARGPAQSPAPSSSVAQQMTPGHPSAMPQRGNQQLLPVYVKKYGVSALLPTELFPDAATKLADANTDQLVSVNGCFRVAFNLLSGPIEKAYDNCIAELRKKADHRTIDYKVLKESWFVISGDSDTSGYYTKGVKRGGGDVIVMQLEYTGDACNVTDAILTEMSRKFDGK